MIMMMDKKKTLTQILGPREDERAQEEPVSECHVIAHDLLDALKSDDVGAVADALRAFVLACGSQGSGEG